MVNSITGIERRRCRVGLGVLLLLGFVFDLVLPGAPAPVSTVRGVVLDAMEAPLPGAVVFVHHWKLKGHSLNDPQSVMEPVVRTDSQGRFSVQLPPGTYEVFVAYPTFAPYAKRVRVESGRELILECKLEFDALTTWIE